MRRFIISVLLMLLFSSGAAAQQLESKPSLFDAPRVAASLARPAPSIREVNYCRAGSTDLKMDVYLPAERDARPAPALIYVHGGGWFQGDKSDGPGLDDIPELLSRGYVVFSINYRLAPFNPFPRQIEDVKCAVRSLRANATNWGIDPNRIGVWGSSAGGHLAALLAMTDRVADFEGNGGYANESAHVLAAAPLFAPTDLTTNEWSVAEQAGFLSVFGATGNWRKASPVNYATKDDAPFLLITGDKDRRVFPIQSQLLHEKLQAANVSSELVIVKNSAHEYGESGSALDPSRVAMTNRVADFFDRYVKLAPAMVSAASYQSDALAPEAMAAAFGVNLSTETRVATTQPLPTTLGGVTVLVRDALGLEHFAPLFFVSPTQVNFLLPAETAPGRAVVSIIRADGSMTTGMTLIRRAFPALFTMNASGKGFPAAYVQRVKSDGSSVIESVAVFDPAQKQFVAAPVDVSKQDEQVYLVMFGSGWRNVASTNSVSVLIGGLAAEVLYAGAQGGFAGLDQLNLRLPHSLAGRGRTDVVVWIEGIQANTVNLTFR